MGGIQLPHCKLRCALEDAPGLLTWACICPEGQEVPSPLSALWRLFTCSKTAETPLDADVYTTESHPEWGIALCAKVERKIPDFFFFPRKIGVYFFCVVRTFPVGRIPNGSLVVQLMAHIRLPRGERDIFQPVL